MPIGRRDLLDERARRYAVETQRDQLQAEVTRLTLQLDQARAAAEVKQLGLHAGDVLALEVPDRLSDEDAARLHHALKDVFPGHRVVIVEGGRLAVIHGDECRMPQSHPLGYAWRDPDDGVVHVLDPADVEILYPDRGAGS